jgi:rubredoxin
MTHQSPPPTVAQLAGQYRAGFSFRCRPCNRSKTYAGPDLVARVGTEETWESLKARTVCPVCGMPVDGVFRTFDFHCATDPDMDRKAGLRPRGWSGPRQTG